MTSPSSEPVSSEMAINAIRLDFTSKINGRAYRLLISIPRKSAAPPPVIYLIDGNLHFGIAVDTARIQSRWPDVKDPVIVGIGYQTDSVTEALTVRILDLTMPTTEAFLNSGWIKSMESKVEEFGQMDSYLRVIDEEIKPMVEQVVQIDRKNQILMGHSLGGLTTLHALFRHTGSFQQFVAISPSIWMTDGEVLQHEGDFIKRICAGQVRARVLISVGGEESTPRSCPPGMTRSAEDLRAMNDGCRMVPNVEELGQRLAAHSSPLFEVRTVVHAGDDHNVVPAAGIARGIEFTMRR